MPEPVDDASELDDMVAIAKKASNNTKYILLLNSSRRSIIRTHNITLLVDCLLKN